MCTVCAQYCRMRLVHSIEEQLEKAAEPKKVPPLLFVKFYRIFR